MSSISREVKVEKEPRIESRDKKRRLKKTPSEGRSASPGGSGDTKKVRIVESKQQNARTLFNAEEEEVDRRNPEKDLALHKAAVDELQKVMREIKELKDSGKDATEEIAQKKIHGSLQFVSLRKLNRLAHIRCKKVRDATHEAKQKIDQHHLQLQNLLYEVMHLQKEITKCLEFKSKHEEIDLVPEEQFFKEAPKEISKLETTKKDPHQLTLARLDWELEQRKRLSEQFKEAQNSKELMSQEIKTKKEYLESLQPKLNTILQSTKPVQDYLGMPFDENREQHRTATYLPRPLYVLYMQSSAYRDACDKHLSVSIQGDVDVAKAMENATPEVDDDSDSDAEEQEKQSSKRRRRRSEDRMAQRREKILRKHPLSVVMTIKCKDGSVLQLTFYYIVSLEIVTVMVRLTPPSDVVLSAISAGDLLSPEALLNCIYPDHQGTDTPNPSNHYDLHRLGMDEFHTYIPKIGKPYLWVQWLAGLTFLNDKESSRLPSSVSASHMEETIKRLRRRVRARLSMQKQLASLERCSIPVSSEYQPLFPAKLSSRLAQWRRITYEDFVTIPYTKDILVAGLAKDTDLFFSGFMERGSAKMTFQIVVNSDYPSSAPVFAVSVLWKAERSNLNDENIRVMEAEVNIYYPELMKEKSYDQLLTNQMQRLLMCFDVYLETEGDNAAFEGPTEFSKEKIFPRVTRGPQRGKPYKYNPQVGFFSQR